MLERLKIRRILEDVEKALEEFGNETSQHMSLRKRSKSYMKRSEFAKTIEPFRIGHS